jgi:phage major head subunit gpT-like protein
MATFRGTAPELLEKRCRRVYFNEYRMQPPVYSKVANVIKSSQAFEDTLKVAGLGTLALKPEGTPVAYDDPVQGTRKRTVHSTYALGFRVTMEMLQDEQYNIIDKMPQDLGRSTADHKERIFFDLFNNAFGTAYTGLDALQLCSTAHVLLKAGTTGISNRANPGVALSVSGLESAMTNFSLTRDESGRYISLTPKMLLIHPNEQHNAVQLLKTQKEPFTAENQVSTVSTSQTGIVDTQSPHLSDTDAWFLLSGKAQHSIIFYNRMPVTFSNTKDSQTKDSLFDAMYRASVTFDDWRGVYGSQP